MILKRIVGLMLILQSTILWSQSDVALNNEIVKIEKRLAIEFCSPLSFTFCNGGYDVPFKLTPTVINFDSLNFLNSYNDTVFIYQLTNALVDSTVLQCFSDSNIIKVNLPSNYRKAIKKQIRKNDLNVQFDGYFRYAYVNLSMNCRYLGTKKILVPNYDLKNSDDLFVFKDCPVYEIINIDSAIPIKTLIIGIGRKY
jgi:hypothetical protein